MKKFVKKIRQKLSKRLQLVKNNLNLLYMEKINFNERLKELRQEVGITQTALASEIGATQRQVSFWEKGQIEPNIFWLSALADFFNVSVDYLIGRIKD